MELAPTVRATDPLVAKLRAGEDSAFEDLVKNQGPRMLATARRLMRTDEDAHDAVQDAFLSVFRNIDSFDGESCLSTWLHRVVFNAALMRLRGARRRPQVSLEALQPATDDGWRQAAPLPVWPAEQESGLLQEEQSAWVRALIDRLPDPHRTVLILRDVQELTTGEVAEALQLSEGAVKVRLHRARQALKALIEPGPDAAFGRVRPRGRFRVPASLSASGQLACGA